MSVILVGITALFAPNLAFACGNCSRGIAWLAFPPLITMSYIGPIWLLTLGLIASILKEKIPQIGQFWKLLLLVILGVVCDLAMSGIALGILMLIVVVIWSRNVITGKTPCSTRSFPLLVKITGIVAILCTAALGTSAMMGERSASEAVMRYGTPAPFFGLSRNEDKQIEARKLIKKATAPHHVEVAALILSKVPDPKVDIPLLIGAMEKFGGQLDISYEMKKISGLDLPKGTTPEIWRREWEKKASGTSKDVPSNQIR